MTEEGPRLDAVAEWVTIAEASRLAGVSDKTMRRRIARGEVEARMEGNHYLINARTAVPGATGRELIPVALLDRLDALRVELQAEAVARAKAEAVAQFQAERAAEEALRRHQLEAERDSLQQEVQRLQARRWWQRR